MPISFTLDADKRRVNFAITGTFALHDIIDSLKSILDLPEFGPHFQVLSDHRGVERPATVRDVEDMLAFMRASRERFAGMRWAIVTHRPASYAMMGMLSTLADLHVRMEVRVFTRPSEATAWLDGESSRAGTEPQA
jgi:hypothetical protein